ncbi:unnamed protein product, partial [Durusdinium trenchii]
HYADSRLSEQGIRIVYGMFSKFATQHCLMRQGFDGPPALCLGNATWACLFWPLEKVSIPGGSDGYALDSGGSAYWGHVVNPEEWQFLTIALGKMPKTDLANCILDHIGMGDDSALRIKELLRKPQPESEPTGAADGPQLGSTLDVLVLWDMPPEDQKEFQDAQELI